MFTSDDASKNPPYVLAELVPIDQVLTTGGSHVDEALSLWFGWRDASDGLPDWSLFKPFEHPHLLAHLILCKRIDTLYFSVVVGGAVQNWLPPKIQGNLLHDAMPEVNANDVQKRCNRALDDKLPNYVEKTMVWNPKHDFLRYRALYLPFKSSRDGNHRILIVFDFECE